MSDEEEFFMQEMEGVKPLDLDEKADVKKSQDDALTLENRRINAVTEKLVDKNYLSSDHVELIDPYYVMSFKRSGVQNGVFRRLKQGRYAIDTRLDLHRMTVDHARREVYDFIQECMQHDLRSLMLVHGRGQHKKPDEDKGTALLKSYVNKWLQEISEVLAFHRAQPQHGGAGAVYVLLKKSERKKDKNRERFSGSRGSAK